MNTWVQRNPFNNRIGIAAKFYCFRATFALGRLHVLAIDLATALGSTLSSAKKRTKWRSASGIRKGTFASRAMENKGELPAAGIPGPACTGSR